MNPERPNGFTLIELLTVIAIIGILAAILIPVVGRVRAQARASKCVSNLRQIGQGIYTYSADNDGYGPAGLNNWEPGGPQGTNTTFHYAIWEHVGYDYSIFASISNPFATTSPMETIFHCPTSYAWGREDPPAEVFYSGTVPGSSLAYSYALNGRASPGSEISAPVMLDNLDAPSQTVAVLEMRDWRHTGGNYATRGTVPHEGSANFLFYDGHVGRRSRAEISPPTTSPRDVFWWGPNAD